MENSQISPVKGLKLIRTANIIAILSTCISLVSVAMMVIGAFIGFGPALDPSSLVPSTITPAAIIVAAIGFLGTMGGLILVLVGGIMEIVGLTKSTSAHSGYKTALMLVAINVGLSFCSVFLPLPEIFSNIFSVLNPALGAMVVFFVISSTATLLKGKGDLALAENGIKVRNIYIICATLSLAAELIVFVPQLASVISIFTAIASIVQLIALFKYIKFLGKSVKVFQV